jgi:hypothetical protein
MQRGHLSGASDSNRGLNENPHRGQRRSTTFRVPTLRSSARPLIATTCSLGPRLRPSPGLDDLVDPVADHDLDVRSDCVAELLVTHLLLTA